MAADQQADGPELEDPEADAAELIAQIRQLAGSDPIGVQQVVADVLAALDRVTGGALREQFPEVVTLGVADRGRADPDWSPRRPGTDRRADPD